MILAAGGMLPAVSLTDAQTGEMLALRRVGGPRVLLVVHAASCEPCQRYLRDLGSVTDRVGEWGGRITVILPGAAEDAKTFQEALPYRYQILLDPADEVGGGEAAVVVADSWGEVYSVAKADAGHELSPPEDLLAWVQFLAIHCPECEGPEGAWRRL